MRYRFVLGLACSCCVAPLRAENATTPDEELQALRVSLSQEFRQAYLASPFSALSTDYFLRFSRDPNARPEPNETMIDDTWRIIAAPDSGPLAQRMADHLRAFLDDRMGVSLPIEARPEPIDRAIVLQVSGGGDAAVPESFTVRVTDKAIVVAAHDENGLRDGIVRLINRIGLREAPILPQGETIYRPRVGVRVGSVPVFGQMRDVAMFDYNGILIHGESFYGWSTSDAIPELAAWRAPDVVQRCRQQARRAREYGLKTYLLVDTVRKFREGDPIFKAHPQVRGIRTFSKDGPFTLCTEAPLVQQYQTETVESIFRNDPQLDGLLIIVGGEGFYHCFMRCYGAEKGHTTCPRCEALGPAKVVANLCNRLAAAARKYNPNAVILAWPYSAVHIWNMDRAHTPFIEALGPGTGLFTEIIKDEAVDKPFGVRKTLWDYSIDLIGPGERAKQQIALCHKQGIPIHIKSEPEMGYEASRLPHIPCMDRWAARAEALASCGATGAWVIPYFRSFYGTSAGEITQWFFWDPAPSPEALLSSLANRIAGQQAGPLLRRAWKLTSEAIDYSPEIPAYYNGPTYLGPAHPMCADPNAQLPDVFYGRYLYMAERDAADGLKRRPTFQTALPHKDEAYEKLYREMAQRLKQAAAQVDEADPLVDDRHRMTFDAEALPIRWFYHTIQTTANFYESCRIRDRVLALGDQPTRTPDEQAEAKELYARWREVLANELENARAAGPVAEGDMRLDFHFGGDHSFAHTRDMLGAKIGLLEHELDTFLPSVAERCGVQP